MKVKVTCEKCGRKVYEAKDMDVLLPEECEEHVCPPSLHDCRAQFGRSDVETLAQAMYHVFHGDTSEKYEPWDKFSRLRDEVVEAFRTAAVEAALRFSDGRIGGIYYGGV